MDKEFIILNPEKYTDLIKKTPGRFLKLHLSTHMIVDVFAIEDRPDVFYVMDVCLTLALSQAYSRPRRVRSER